MNLEETSEKKSSSSSSTSRRQSTGDRGAAASLLAPAHSSSDSLSLAPRSSRKGAVPDGVEHMTDLPHGYGVGYHADGQKVMLYDKHGTGLAHVEIKSHGRNLSLHTRTLSGDEGGQGHMTAMFPTALRVLHERFGSTHDSISMIPAVGGATKGLISNLARARATIGHGFGIKAKMDYTAGMTFLDRAKEQRRRRKAAEPSREQSVLQLIASKFRSSSSSSTGRSEAQEWKPHLMQETANELDALRHMERSGTTGLSIQGVAQRSTAEPGGFYEPIVGPDSKPGYEGSGHRWFAAGNAAAKESGEPPTLVLGMKMLHLPGYIHAFRRLEQMEK